MKFRVIISILTLIIIALFIIAVSQSYKLKAAYDKLDETYQDLVTSEKALKITNAELDTTNSQLVKTMKELKIYTDEEKSARLKQVNLGKFTIGIDAEAKNKDLYKVIAYAIESGFKLEYARKASGSVFNPIIYYYSEEGQKAAETFVKDLSAQFPNLAEITTQRGGSNSSASLITASLRFEY